LQRKGERKRGKPWEAHSGGLVPRGGGKHGPKSNREKTTRGGDTRNLKDQKSRVEKKNHEQDMLAKKERRQGKGKKQYQSRTIKNVGW